MIAPEVDSKTVGPITPAAAVRDIKSLSITHGTNYSITGTKKDGTHVSWSGSNRDSAIATMTKFLGRLT